MSKTPTALSREAVRLLSQLSVRPEQIMSGHDRIEAIVDTMPTDEMALKYLGELLRHEPMED